jgi:hypothetical protein
MEKNAKYIPVLTAVFLWNVKQHGACTEFKYNFWLDHWS